MSYPLPVQIRPMVRAGLMEVMAVDELSSPFPWTRFDFVAYFRHSVSLMHVAETYLGGRLAIAGFLVYYGGVACNFLHVTNIAVHPALRRRRIGTQLLRHIAVRRSGPSLRRLEILVPERSLGAQLWLRKLEFKAESVVRACYGDGPDAQDGYLFVCSEQKDQTCRAAEVQLRGES